MPIRFSLRAVNGQEYPITGPFRIGREPECQIQIDNRLVSRIHASIWLDHDHLLLRDERSRNGTQLNGQPLTPGEANYLHHDDEVKIGDAVLTVVSDPPYPRPRQHRGLPGLAEDEPPPTSPVDQPGPAPAPPPPSAAASVPVLRVVRGASPALASPPPSAAANSPAPPVVRGASPAPASPPSAAANPPAPPVVRGASPAPLPAGGPNPLAGPNVFAPDRIVEPPSPVPPVGARRAMTLPVVIGGCLALLLLGVCCALGLFAVTAGGPALLTARAPSARRTATTNPAAVTPAPANSTAVTPAPANSAAANPAAASAGQRVAPVPRAIAEPAAAKQILSAARGASSRCFTGPHACRS